MKLQERYKHKRTGGIYHVVARVKMKQPVSREWVDAVLYRGIDSSTLFVRWDLEFREKFEKCLPTTE